MLTQERARASLLFVGHRASEPIRSQDEDGETREDREREKGEGPDVHRDGIRAQKKRAPQALARGLAEPTAPPGGTAYLPVPLGAGAG